MFFKSEVEKYRKEAKDYKELWEKEQEKTARLQSIVDGAKAVAAAKDKTLLKLERIIRKGTTQASREDIRKLTLEEIERLIKEATQDLLAYKTVASSYTPYRHRTSYRAPQTKDREEIVMETVIGELEEHIENLTREKYRKILDAEEMGGNEQ